MAWPASAISPVLTRWSLRRVRPGVLWDARWQQAATARTGHEPAAPAKQPCRRLSCWLAGVGTASPLPRLLRIILPLHVPVQMCACCWRGRSRCRRSASCIPAGRCARLTSRAGTRVATHGLAEQPAASCPCARGRQPPLQHDGARPNRRCGRLAPDSVVTQHHCPRPGRLLLALQGCCPAPLLVVLSCCDCLSVAASFCVRWQLLFERVLFFPEMWKANDSGC